MFYREVSLLFVIGEGWFNVYYCWCLMCELLFIYGYVWLLFVLFVVGVSDIGSDGMFVGVLGGSFVGWCYGNRNFDRYYID